MRLNNEQIQERKEGYLRGKEILAGRMGEGMFDNLLDFIDTIEAQQQEIDYWKNQAEALRITCDAHISVIDEQQQTISALQQDLFHAEGNLGIMTDLHKQLQAQINEAREAIPKICKLYDFWSCESYQGKEMGCPEICGEWAGEV